MAYLDDELKKYKKFGSTQIEFSSVYDPEEFKGYNGFLKRKGEVYCIFYIDYAGKPVIECVSLTDATDFFRANFVTLSRLDGSKVSINTSRIVQFEKLKLVELYKVNTDGNTPIVTDEVLIRRVYPLNCDIN